MYRRLLPRLAAIGLGLFQPVSAELLINATTKPGATWRQRPTTVLADLAKLPPDLEHDRFGGLPHQPGRATGYFRSEKIDGRWWLLTPEGGLFISRGLNSVALVKTQGGKAALAQKFGTQDNWAAQTVGLLRSNGFNTLGGWSDLGALEKPGATMPKALIWSFMSSYGKVRGGTYQKPGHTGYPNGCPFIFDPGFAGFCETYARKLEAHKDNPWVIGHFSDNELPWSRKMLENYLELPAADPGHQAAAEWLAARRKKSAGRQEITDADRADFLGFAVERYIAIVGAALRKHAPNHLFLGPRLHGGAIRLPEVFKALGPHVDVLSVNYYNSWTPDEKLMEMWTHESGRPFMVTEFYVKSVDSGMPNQSGAGWLVRSDKDRGAFYQNFTLGLIRSRGCVGWHWHRYADNDPADTRQDPSNRDSNKGVVNNRYEPFADLLESMRSIHERIGGLVKHHDSK